MRKNKKDKARAGDKILWDGLGYDTYKSMLDSDFERELFRKMKKYSLNMYRLRNNSREYVGIRTWLIDMEDKEFRTMAGDVEVKTILHYVIFNIEGNILADGHVNVDPISTSYLVAKNRDTMQDSMVIMRDGTYISVSAHALHRFAERILGQERNHDMGSLMKRLSREIFWSNAIVDTTEIHGESGRRFRAYLVAERLVLVGYTHVNDTSRLFAETCYTYAMFPSNGMTPELLNQAYENMRDMRQLSFNDYAMAREIADAHWGFARSYRATPTDKDITAAHKANRDKRFRRLATMSGAHFHGRVPEGSHAAVVLGERRDPAALPRP